MVAPDEAPTSDPVAAARGLVDLVRDGADEAERDRRLPDRIARALARAGLHRVAAPASLGGLECHPATQIETIEIVSTADGATGWTLMIGIENQGFLGAALPRAFAEKVYADPELIVAGALNPLGRATRVDGGLRVTGRWPFASGCHNARFFWGQCVVEGIEPPNLREVLLPEGDFEILDTWHVSGLRGSGSHDVECRDLFVPDERVTQVFGGTRREGGTLFRLPPFSRLAYNKVGVATGIARAAIDAFAQLASSKTPRGSQKPLRERSAAQLAVAEAETRLRSARAFVMETVGDLWRTVEAGDRVTSRQQALNQLACSSAAAESVRAVEAVHAAAGTSANFLSSPLERCLRDVRVIPQHIMVSPQWREGAGRVLLGVESGTPIF